MYCEPCFSCLLHFSAFAMKYHVVQFEDGIMVVCDSWINIPNQSCSIPSEKIGRKLTRQHPPDEKWKSYGYESILLSHGKLISFPFDTPD